MALPVGQDADAARHAELPLPRVAARAGALHVRRRHGVPRGHRARGVCRARSRYRSPGCSRPSCSAPALAWVFFSTPELFPAEDLALRGDALPRRVDVHHGVPDARAHHPLQEARRHDDGHRGARRGRDRRRDRVVPARRGARELRRQLEPRAGEHRRRRGLRGPRAADRPAAARAGAVVAGSERLRSPRRALSSGSRSWRWAPGSPICIGLHAVFGAFVMGAAMPRGVVARDLIGRIQPLTVALLLPLFFTYSGLNTKIAPAQHGLPLADVRRGARRRRARQGRGLLAGGACHGHRRTAKRSASAR